MSMKGIALFIILSTVATVIIGIPDFSCDTVRPFSGSDVTCKCVSPNNIEWQLNDVSLSTCTTTGICSPKPAGYKFTTDTSNADKEYSLTVQGYDYNSCTVYSCTDFTTLEEQTITLSIAVFDSTSPSVFVEPGEFTSGNIEITTECLFKESDITAEWYYVEKNSVTEVPYTPGASFQTSTNCADTCNGDLAVRLNIGFTHTEDGTQEVKFVLRVYHKENSTDVLEVQTSFDYKIKKVKDGCPGLGNSEAVDSTGECACAWFGICCAIIVCTISIGLVIELIFAPWGDLGNTAKIVLRIYIIGFGFVICWAIRRTLATNKPGGNDSTNKSSDDIPLNKNQSHVMNTKYANPPGGHAQQDHAQPLRNAPPTSIDEHKYF